MSISLISGMVEGKTADRLQHTDEFVAINRGVAPSRAKDLGGPDETSAIPGVVRRERSDAHGDVGHGLSPDAAQTKTRTGQIRDPSSCRP